MWQLLYFSLSEGLLSLWRSRVLNLLSIGTIMFAMFVLGSFIFVGRNLKKVSINWHDQIQFHVFLKDQNSEVEREALAGFFQAQTTVETSEFLSKKEAQKRFESDFSGYAEVVDGLANNPFPASFQVVLHKEVGSDAFEALRTQLADYAGIEEVFYDEEIFERLRFLANLVQMSGWFFGGILIFSSVFSISNVLKLTFFTKREEVDIMKLVGASRGFIRGPFIVEAVFQGLLGAFFGILTLWLSFFGLNFYLNQNPTSLFGQLDLAFLPLSWILLLCGIGGLSGLLGSIFSLNQFLEEHISYQ